MLYRTFGPYSLKAKNDDSKIVIENKDIKQFWDKIGSTPALGESNHIKDACGIYIFTTTTPNHGEKPSYVGKASKQSFSEESFTRDKLNKYREAITKSTILVSMYFLVRCLNSGKMSRPSRSDSTSGHADMDFVEKYFISRSYLKNPKLVNIQNTKFAEKHAIEGFFGSKDQRRKSVKKLNELLKD